MQHVFLDLKKLSVEISAFLTFLLISVGKTFSTAQKSGHRPTY